MVAMHQGGPGQCDCHGEHSESVCNIHKARSQHAGQAVAEPSVSCHNDYLIGDSEEVIQCISFKSIMHSV